MALSTLCLLHMEELNALGWDKLYFRDLQFRVQMKVNE